MTNKRTMKRTEEECSTSGIWRYIGGAALVLLAAGIAVNIPDIKRYIRISTM